MREIFFHGESAGQPSGSPPLAREGHTEKVFLIPYYRITPARAGRTFLGMPTVKPRRDHPRVCGKDLKIIKIQCQCLGSPPRVREGLIRCNSIVNNIRITPARAGRTSVFIKIQTLTKDHPRVRGKDFPVPGITPKS